MKYLIIGRVPLAKTQRVSDELLFKDLIEVQERKVDVYKFWSPREIAYLDPASVVDIHTELLWKAVEK